MTRTFPSGTVAHYDEAGRLHADNQPAVTHPDGSFAWFRHGKTHREEGPAVFVKLDDGSEISEDWIDGELQEDDRPARDAV